MSKRFLISKDVKLDLYQNDCRAVVIVNLPNDVPAGIKNDIIANLDNSNITPRKKHDPDWNRMPFERHYHADPQALPKPACYDEMIRISKKLSEGLPFVRVDLYEVAGRVYCGEITLYPGSGMETFQPESWDYTLGSWIDLKKYFPQEFQD